MVTFVSDAVKAAVTLLAAQQQLQDGLLDSSSSSTTLQSTQENATGLVPTLEIGPPSYENVQGEPCVLSLGTHVFGYSYGAPSVTTFDAPFCGEDYSRAYLKWEAQCEQGVQYDRLAAVWINGVELLRTSTEEPSRQSGVKWEVVKDISTYHDVVAAGGTLVIALDNVITSTYTSSFTIDLSIEFYKPLEDNSISKPDLILPVSSSNTTYGWFNVQPSTLGENGKLITLPSNTEELYLEVFLSHHQCDEFYYSNPPNDYAKLLNTCGNGPFREVQVLIDDELVGVIWPFSLLYTGGLNPYLWRPVVAIGAFNAPTYVLDLTPFLSLFLGSTDSSHNVTFFVDNGIDFWPIDGNLLVYLDANSTQTNVTVLEKRIDRHVVPLTSASPLQGYNASFTVSATRDFYIQSRVETSKGAKIYTIDQQLSYTNTQNYTLDAQMELFEASTTIHTVQTVQEEGINHTVSIKQMEHYPLRGSSEYYKREDKSWVLAATISNALSRTVEVVEALNLSSGSSFAGFRYDFEPMKVEIALNGSAILDSHVGGNGSTDAIYHSISPTGDCFSRYVAAEFGQLVKDVSSDECEGPSNIRAIE